MTNSLTNSDNRFPNCLRMELRISPIDQEEAEHIDLILDIHFGEHQEEIHYGSGNVTFGLKRGVLKIKLTKGKVPLKNIKLKNVFQTVVEKEIQEEWGRESQSGVQVELKNQGFNAGLKQAGKKSEKVNTQEYQVNFGGGKLDEPRWIFEVKTGRDILEGLLQNTELATIKIESNESKPCLIVATFEAEKPEDICVTNGELFGSKNITKKRIAVIERKLVRLFLDEVLNQKPYLSRVKLTYE